MPVFALNENEISFPLPQLAEDDGLLAVGGDLSRERLVLAYSNGIFPWYNEGQPIMWWCPRERYIIRPGNVHISHSMKKFMRKHDIRVEVNRDFSDTMHRCRIKREFAEGTWITTDMENAYADLAANNLALSVDAFIDGELAGGLYGVSLGRCFFGESMFSDMENGSKLALIGLSQILAENGYVFIDCQFHTDHLESMGGERITYQEYKELLDQGL
ncbi:leucyl/phenylalanyl-tRNA-protein transferase Aat [Butyrivibrio proteoclasticus B316]|uniref:Leucyl/phenylalanyl-tRNA--protein transferase n=1 Tax=Butyrivibrio proteoclasticus (strain ATCC 51982 / DSM 14932 / B316) TaxID=515622 RepID=E0RVG3_BUTPB|nr:leucyl/phenylalanyl-tRNA--protein transferase [Butyrivibrio proteoclasticus]ADL34812.1 leucyl/phenylalanyl-tRNA-protein transferase Aat [Butyrivibrio proteoclasticus B316]